MDIEIKCNEEESLLEDQLRKLAISADCEFEQKLKDKHTQERLLMLKEIAPGSNETVKQYIEKEQKDLVKALEQFREEK